MPGSIKTVCGPLRAGSPGWQLICHAFPAQAQWHEESCSDCQPCLCVPNWSLPHTVPSTAVCMGHRGQQPLGLPPHRGPCPADDACSGGDPQLILIVPSQVCVPCPSTWVQSHRALTEVQFMLTKTLGAGQKCEDRFFPAACWARVRLDTPGFKS